MIPDEKVVITISHAGYIKRTPLAQYKTQNHGGVGQKASTTRNEDFLEHLLLVQITNISFFTQREDAFGYAYLRSQKDLKHLKVAPSKT